MALYGAAAATFAHDKRAAARHRARGSARIARMAARLAYCARAARICCRV
jgi:hypothetical protein